MHQITISIGKDVQWKILEIKESKGLMSKIDSNTKKAQLGVIIMENCGVVKLKLRKKSKSVSLKFRTVQKKIWNKILIIIPM